MNIANFASRVEERNGSEGGNVDLIQRYKYIDKDFISLNRFRYYIVSGKVKSLLDLCFSRETIYYFLLCFRALNEFNNNHI